jgi:uncharacterized RDD family membrane protein YckC
MRCPKCQYISFDSGNRCRNCGYEFSLTIDPASVDLPIQTGDEALGPLSDFALDVKTSPVAESKAAAPGLDIAAMPAAGPITSSFDLPLFKERRPDEPTALGPRAPLAVRRSSPLPSRGGNRPSLDEPVLDLGVPAPPERPWMPAAIASPTPSAPATPSEHAKSPDGADTQPLAAAIGPRLLAAIVDVSILGSIGLVVLYLTLKVCGLQFAGAAAIPPVPFGAFLLLVAGGYFTLFTAAGGQTIGKMAAGIRVVAMGGAAARVPLGHSVVRATAYLVSAIPAGLGFVPALLGADRRAIHDRLADTRVVKA